MPEPDGMIIGSNASPSNPTPLSAPQEQQVRDLYYKNVRAKCAKEIELFASCALNRTLTLLYACRAPRLAMNSCMLQYQNQDELDQARAEWFAKAGERRKEREAQRRRVEEGRERHKEWWGLKGEDGGDLHLKRGVGDSGGGAGAGAGGQGEGDAGLKRKEESRVDGRGVVRGGIYRGT